MAQEQESWLNRHTHSVMKREEYASIYRVEIIVWPCPSSSTTPKSINTVSTYAVIVNGALDRRARRYSVRRPSRSTLRVEESSRTDRICVNAINRRTGRCNMYCEDQ